MKNREIKTGPLWPDLKTDISDELRLHLELLEQEYRASGLSEAEARAAALRRFGQVTRVEEECVQIGKESQRMYRRREWWSTLWQDARFGFRQLRSNPLMSVIAVLTLALGIGANTAIFSVVNGVLLRPLPYHDAERLLVSSMSQPDYRDLTARMRAFDRTAIWASNIYSVRDNDEPEEIMGGIVSSTFFPLLAEPLLGRTIDAENERTAVAVISHSYWQRRYAGTRDVLGRTINLSSEPYTIVGVMPPDFAYPDRTFDVWVPVAFAMTKTPAQLEDRAFRIFRFVGHLTRGATIEQANAEAGQVSEELQRLYPETNANVSYAFTRLYDLLVGRVRSALWILLGVVGLVLLIACANVANLLLGLTAARAREIAVRRALGAGRFRLVRQLITESAVLAVLGGVAGVQLAWLLVRALPRMTNTLPRMTEISLDGSVLIFALLASAATAILFGIAPALHGARGDLTEVLNEGGRGGVGSRRGGWLRSSLVAAEVALSVIVLVGATLLVQSLMRVVNQDIGFAPEHLVSANIGLFYFDDPAQRTVKLEQALQRIARIPGVELVAGGSGLPPQTPQRGTGFSVPGRVPDQTEQNGAFWLGITPGYFATLRARVVRGREFTERDDAGGAPVALINESLARSLFGDTDPVGRQIRLTNPEAGAAMRTIVGVVPDVRYAGVENSFVSAIYTPFAQAPFLWSYLMVRSSLPAEQLARPLRQAVGGIDPRMAPARVMQHSAVVGDLIATRRFLTLLLAGFALLALVLAAVGIYGVIAYNVTQRRREIGVRLALGARPSAVVRQIVGRALALAGIGVSAGLLAAFWLTRLLTSQLYDVQSSNPAAYLGGALLLGTIALAASSLPALRASHLDPANVLRE